MVNQRAAVLERLGRAVDLIREAATIAGAAHLGMPAFNVCTGYGHRSAERSIAASRVMPQRDGRTFDREANDRAELDSYIAAGVDGAAWSYLMHESGLRSMMDAKARMQWDETIARGEVPALTAETVRATFQALHASRGEMFERGVIECFRSLSWCYKTNQPQKFGRRIVLTYIRGSIAGKSGGSSLGHPNYDRCAKLDDLARVFHVLDGKPEPDHRAGWYQRLTGQRSTSEAPASDGYLSARSFRNGNAHVTLLRADLVDRMNRIVAKHYPGALPAPRG
jgi:hypothetical protein